VRRQRLASARTFGRDADDSRAIVLTTFVVNAPLPRALGAFFAAKCMNQARDPSSQVGFLPVSPAIPSVGEPSSDLHSPSFIDTSCVRVTRVARFAHVRRPAAQVRAAAGSSRAVRRCRTRIGTVRPFRQVAQRPRTSRCGAHGRLRHARRATNSQRRSIGGAPNARVNHPCSTRAHSTSHCAAFH
jgi:hypothetical protein